MVPKLVRTTDNRGSWAPVTFSIEDPANGLESEPIRLSRVATSGRPGEVAAIVGRTVYFSKVFGLSWMAVEGAIPPRDWSQLDYPLYSGHAGSTSVLLVVASDGTYRADVTADVPALQRMDLVYAGPDDAMERTGAPYVAVGRGVNAELDERQARLVNSSAMGGWFRLS